MTVEKILAFYKLLRKNVALLLKIERVANKNCMQIYKAAVVLVWFAYYTWYGGDVKY